jgi:membrane protease subunit HflK
MISKNTETFETILNSLIKYSKWIVIVAIILILLSGVVVVQNDEAAVVLRFGKIMGQGEDQIKGPGLHFTFPYIVDEVIKVPVGKVQEQSIVTHYGEGSWISSDIPNSGYILTGDQNIILIKVIAKYRIDDPVQYALYYNEIPQIIDGVISGELNQIVSNMNVDSVLTSGKSEIVSALTRDGQRQFNEIGVGIKITNIELTDVVPPSETVKFFNGVNTAAVEKETRIQQAKQYQSAAIPEAEAKSSTLIKKAQIDQSNLVSIANSEASEFNGLYQQYVTNPKAIMNGAFRVRVAAAMQKMGATIVIPEDGTPPKLFLP